MFDQSRGPVITNTAIPRIIAGKIMFSSRNGRLRYLYVETVIRKYINYAQGYQMPKTENQNTFFEDQFW